MEGLQNQAKEIKTAIFGGGCFWCTEAVFKMLKGVESVIPGYAKAGVQSGRPPTYEEVSSGSTGYAEVIKIDYDPTQISFEDLLTVFFASHDPTTLNRQGADVGTQYRSIILYADERQKYEAEKFIEELNKSSKDGQSITTEIAPFGKFFQAESYHLDYYTQNQDAMYCQLVINPKLQKVQEKFAKLLKEKATS